MTLGDPAPAVASSVDNLFALFAHYDQGFPPSHPAPEDSELSLTKQGSSGQVTSDYHPPAATAEDSFERGEVFDHDHYDDDDDDEVDDDRFVSEVITCAHRTVEIEASTFDSEPSSDEGEADDDNGDEAGAAHHEEEDDAEELDWVGEFVFVQNRLDSSGDEPQPFAAASVRQRAPIRKSRKGSTASQSQQEQAKRVASEQPPQPQQPYQPLLYPTAAASSLKLTSVSAVVAAAASSSAGVASSIEAASSEHAAPAAAAAVPAAQTPAAAALPVAANHKNPEVGGAKAAQHSAAFEKVAAAARAAVQDDRSALDKPASSKRSGSKSKASPTRAGAATAASTRKARGGATGPVRTSSYTTSPTTELQPGDDIFVFADSHPTELDGSIWADVRYVPLGADRDMACWAKQGHDPKGPTAAENVPQPRHCCGVCLEEFDVWRSLAMHTLEEHLEHAQESPEKVALKTPPSTDLASLVSKRRDSAASGLSSQDDTRKKTRKKAVKTPTKQSSQLDSSTDDRSEAPSATRSHVEESDAGTSRRITRRQAVLQKQQDQDRSAEGEAENDKVNSNHADDKQEDDDHEGAADHVLTRLQRQKQNSDPPSTRANTKRARAGSIHKPDETAASGGGGDDDDDVVEGKGHDEPEVENEVVRMQQAAEAHKAPNRDPRQNVSAAAAAAPQRPPSRTGNDFIQDLSTSQRRKKRRTSAENPENHDQSGPSSPMDMDANPAEEIRQTDVDADLDASWAMDADDVSGVNEPEPSHHDSNTGLDSDSDDNAIIGKSRRKSRAKSGGQNEDDEEQPKKRAKGSPSRTSGDDHADAIVIPDDDDVYADAKPVQRKRRLRLVSSDDDQSDAEDGLVVIGDDSDGEQTSAKVSTTKKRQRASSAVDEDPDVITVEGCHIVNSAAAAGSLFAIMADSNGRQFACSTSLLRSKPTDMHRYKIKARGSDDTSWLVISVEEETELPPQTATYPDEGEIVSMGTVIVPWRGTIARYKGNKIAWHLQEAFLISVSQGAFASLPDVLNVKTLSSVSVMCDYLGDKNPKLQTRLFWQTGQKAVGAVLHIPASNMRAFQLAIELGQEIPINAVYQLKGIDGSDNACVFLMSTKTPLGNHILRTARKHLITLQPTTRGQMLLKPVESLVALIAWNSNDVLNELSAAPEASEQVYLRHPAGFMGSGLALRAEDHARDMMSKADAAAPSALSRPISRRAMIEQAARTFGSGQLAGAGAGGGGGGGLRRHEGVRPLGGSKDPRRQPTNPFAPPEMRQPDTTRRFSASSLRRPSSQGGGAPPLPGSSSPPTPVFDDPELQLPPSPLGRHAQLEAGGHHAFPSTMSDGRRPSVKAEYPQASVRRRDSQSHADDESIARSRRENSVSKRVRPQDGDAGRPTQDRQRRDWIEPGDTRLRPITQKFLLFLEKRRPNLAWPQTRDRLVDEYKDFCRDVWTEPSPPNISSLLFQMHQNDVVKVVQSDYLHWDEHSLRHVLDTLRTSNLADDSRHRSSSTSDGGHTHDRRNSRESRKSSSEPGTAHKPQKSKRQLNLRQKKFTVIGPPGFISSVIRLCKHRGGIGFSSEGRSTRDLVNLDFVFLHESVMKSIESMQQITNLSRLKMVHDVHFYVLKNEDEIDTLMRQPPTQQQICFPQRTGCVLVSLSFALDVTSVRELFRVIAEANRDVIRWTVKVHPTVAKDTQKVAGDMHDPRFVAANDTIEIFRDGFRKQHAELLSKTDCVLGNHGEEESVAAAFLVDPYLAATAFHVQHKYRETIRHTVIMTNDLSGKGDPHVAAEHFGVFFLSGMSLFKRQFEGHCC